MLKSVSCHWVPGHHLSGLRRRPGASAAACRRRATAVAARRRPQRPATVARSAAPGPDVSQQRAVLDQYCVVCHNEKLKTANLLLDQAGSRARRGSPGDRRKGRAETAGRHDAALRHAAPGFRRRRESLISWMEKELDATRTTASAAAGHSSPEPRRIHERDPRPARAGSGCLEVPAVGRLDARVRQHRRRLDDVARADGSVSVGGRQDQPPRDWHARPRRPRRCTSRRRTSARTTTSKGLPFGTRGGMLIKHEFPADAYYVFQVFPINKGNMGGSGAFGEVTGEQLEVTVDGEQVHQFDWDTELHERHGRPRRRRHRVDLRQGGPAHGRGHVPRDQLRAGQRPERASSCGRRFRRARSRA